MYEMHVPTSSQTALNFKKLLNGESFFDTPNFTSELLGATTTGVCCYI